MLSILETAPRTVSDMWDIFYEQHHPRNQAERLRQNAAPAETKK